MKKGILVSLLTLLALLSITTSATSQVTIGSATKNNSGSLLDLKERNTPGANSTHGLALPRVNLQKSKYLSPMLDHISEYQDGNPRKKQEDQAHTGLVVYNLTNDKAEDLCIGAYMWNGTQWVRLGRGCPLDYCQKLIESNITPGYYYSFHCDEAITTQADAITSCRTRTNTDGHKTYNYHLMTAQEFNETWNQDPSYFTPNDKYLVDLNGWITLGIIRTDGSMEILGNIAPLAFGPPIGGKIQGTHIARCVKN